MITSAEITRKPDDHTETLGDWRSLDENGATVFTCKTLERPNKNNAAGISCIPKAVYIVKKVGPSHIPYPHFSITNVSGRAGIAIHILNEFFQSEGCVGVGDSYGDINKDGEPDLLNSKKTFDHLYSIMPDEFKLTIK